MMNMNIYVNIDDVIHYDVYVYVFIDILRLREREYLCIRE